MSRVLDLYKSQPSELTNFDYASVILQLYELLINDSNLKIIIFCIYANTFCSIDSIDILPSPAKYFYLFVNSFWHSFTPYIYLCFDLAIISAFSHYELNEIFNTCSFLHRYKRQKFIFFKKLSFKTSLEPELTTVIGTRFWKNILREIWTFASIRCSIDTWCFWTLWNGAWWRKLHSFFFFSQ